MSIKEKLTAELTDAKLGKYETAVKNAVMKTICKFCEQNAEFKQAIEQSRKSRRSRSIQACCSVLLSRCGYKMHYDA